jgi:hypothetical protein
MSRCVLFCVVLGGDPLAGVNRLFNFNGDLQTRVRAALQKVAKEMGPGTPLLNLEIIMGKSIRVHTL